MEYTLLSDNSLIIFLKDSNELAFKEIYMRYWKEIYKTAYLKTHHKELAEEITQNLFVDLWKRRETVTINSLPSYLFGSVKYSIINHFKSQLIRENYHNKMHPHPQHTGSTDDLLLLRDLSEALNEGIALLPKKTGEIFKLSRIDNCSTKEISQQMNISEKAVEYHITQSLKSMRFHLKEYLFLLISAIFLNIL